jgi:hypothetical protein
VERALHQSSKPSQRDGDTPAANKTVGAHASRNTVGHGNRCDDEMSRARMRINTWGGMLLRTCCIISRRPLSSETGDSSGDLNMAYMMVGKLLRHCEMK